MSVDTSAIAKMFGAISAANVVPAIITFVISYFVLKIVVKVVGNLLDRTPMEKTIVRFIRSSLHIVMWVLISIITASALGIDTTSMVALISVASLAVSLAVQGALSNLAGGVTLLSTHPFRVGDFVEVGGVSGTVREIGMTYTTLTTADQKEIFVPNSEVSSSKIIIAYRGCHRQPLRAFCFMIPFAYRSFCLMLRPVWFPAALGTLWVSGPYAAAALCVLLSLKRLPHDGRALLPRFL